MKRLAMVAGVLVSGIALGSTAVLAQMGPGGRGRGRGCGGQGQRGHMGRIMRQLDLTEEQKAKVKTLREEMKTTGTPIRGQMKKKFEEMQALWKSDTPDRAQILAKHAEIDEIRKTVRAARVDFRLSLLAVLTPDQRSKIASLRGSMKKRFRGGFGRRSRRGGGGPRGGFQGKGWGFGPAMDDDPSDGAPQEY